MCPRTILIWPTFVWSNFTDDLAADGNLQIYAEDKAGVRKNFKDAITGRDLTPAQNRGAKPFQVWDDCMELAVKDGYKLLMDCYTVRLFIFDVDADVDDSKSWGSHTYKLRVVSKSDDGNFPLKAHFDDDLGLLYVCGGSDLFAYSITHSDGSDLSSFSMPQRHQTSEESAEREILSQRSRTHFTSGKNNHL